jgi:hypothetical protein
MGAVFQSIWRALRDISDWLLIIIMQVDNFYMVSVSRLATAFQSI